MSRRIETAATHTAPAYRRSWVCSKRLTKAATFTGRKDLLSFNQAMAQIRMEVRDINGSALPDYCGDFLDLRLPVDHSRLAQSLLQMIRDDGGHLVAWSVHFLREGEEIGSWSLKHELAEIAVREARQQTPPAAA
ncbi:hypothetical protein ACQR1W_13715 [Bradyrhizobium sp. HKCCYLS1011]|uniref:hypothetical protein n=1 Tax=Bradyrhizobium sp. HKCCYLS1011 TaxID=3420733 RepID=UPI003EBE335B